MAKISKKVKLLAGSSVIAMPLFVIVCLVFLMFFFADGDQIEQKKEEARAKALMTKYEKVCAGTGKMTGITFGGQMDIILRTLRIVESTENYASPPAGPKATASGAYQFILGTWSGYKSIWGKYGDFSGGAYLAPASVQDEVAKTKVEGIMASGTVDIVGPTWLLGHIPKGSEWDLKIGKNPTPREYQTKWMKIYNFLASVTPATTYGSTSPSYGSADAAEHSIQSFKAKAVLTDTVAVGDIYLGKASTYGNDPITKYVDTGDNNMPALPGATNDNPGVAVWNQGTLGGWWQVTAPNGRTVTLQQTDVGPSTDRMIDINAVAARSAFGYPAKDFPTDQGAWTAKYMGKTMPPKGVTTDTRGVGNAQLDDSGDAAVSITCNPENTGTEDGTPVIDANLPTGPVASDVIVNVYGIRIHKDIASNLQAMMDAMRAAGLNPGGGGYRDPAGQINTRKNNCGSSHYAIYEMPSSSCSPPTAKPGTSMHEKGLAIDFTCGGGTLTKGSPCFNWLKLNAANYGFINFPVEPWHWSTNGH